MQESSQAYVELDKVRQQVEVLESIHKMESRLANLPSCKLKEDILKRIKAIKCGETFH
jgi:hypothetical protein